jgi:hypothetical protein
MFLYLDDIREPIHNSFHIVRNYQECIDIIKNNKIHFLSLDHDLGEKKTGYDVAKYLVQEGIEIKQINIHSANPVGRDNIIQLIGRYFPDTKITCKTKI